MNTIRDTLITAILIYLLEGTQVIDTKSRVTTLDTTEILITAVKANI